LASACPGAAQAALALPILALPVKAGAAEVGEVGFNVLSYKERGLMKITEPIVWARGRFGDGWESRMSSYTLRRTRCCGEPQRPSI